ncbi:MAG TPA: hypothetical protein VIM34_15935 [Burkholderiaceae bacterium]
MQFKSNVAKGIGSERACARPRLVLAGTAHAQIATRISCSHS